MKHLSLISALVVLAACAGGEGADRGAVGANATAPKVFAASLHPRLITLDSHVDIPPDYMTAAADPGQRGALQVDLPKMRDGGLDAAFFIVYVGQKPDFTVAGYRAAYQAALAKFDAIERQSFFYGNEIALVHSAQAAREALEGGKLAALIGIENGYPMGEDLARLDEFHARGARYFGLTHIGHNQLADSANPPGRADLVAEPRHGGLSELGKQAIGRLNALGIMVDVSHTSEAATLQAAKLSKAPVIASHSGVKGVYDHPRNLSDNALRTIAKTGGVVHIVAFDTYLKAPPAEKVAAMRALRAEFGIDSSAAFRALPDGQKTAFRAAQDALHLKWPKAGLDDLMDHIDHAVNVMGIDHVGIASDFGGGGGIRGWENAAQSLAVTAALLGRGYSEADIAKIWGENLLRVLAQTEAAAERLNTAR